MKKIVFLLAVSISIFSCVNPPSYPATPVIRFVSIDKTNINQVTDSVKMIFSFTDGDGDLGAAQTDASNNAFVIDHRKGKPDFTYPYRLPFITPIGKAKGISGEITITLPGVYCIPNKTTDEVIYKIYIKDRAGHSSDTIQTPPITVNCQ